MTMHDKFTPKLMFISYIVFKEIQTGEMEEMLAMVALEAAVAPVVLEAQRTLEDYRQGVPLV